MTKHQIQSVQVDPFMLFKTSFFFKKKKKIIHITGIDINILKYIDIHIYVFCDKKHFYRFRFL